MTQPESDRAASRRYLMLTVFVAGMSTLAIEFTTSRMLQTVYGTSNIVWANVIGLVLLCLTIGYFIGGRLADKRPFLTTFYALVTIAGFASVFFLLLTSVILRTAAAAMAELHIGAMASSLLGVALGLAVPVVLLGCVSPFAIRLAVTEVAEAGRVSGRIYAVSTWGSLLGTYLPVLFTIPEWGSRVTAVFFGSLLLLVGLGGWWQTGGRGRRLALLLPLLLILPVLVWTQGGVKALPGQIYETESAYNYIQVVRWDDCNHLLLNEGQGIHSLYCDGGRVPRISVWSIMLAAPYFQPMVDEAHALVPLQSLAVIGLAAGTIPKQFTQVFGPIAIDGIELDPQIVAVGRRYFDLYEPNIQVVVGDGRYQLNQLAGPYDLITLDAYKVPYIPWHLTTVEFFAEVRARLSAHGVVAVNVGRAPQDRRLVEAITATMQQVFPTIHAIDVPGALNTILVATVQPTTPETLTANLARLPESAPVLLRQALETAVSGLVAAPAGPIIFTDARAPVETMADSLVLRYLLQGGLSDLSGLGQ